MGDRQNKCRPDTPEQGNRSPARPGLLPGAGRRRMTRRTFSGEVGEKFSEGGGGRTARHDLSRG